MCCCELVVQRIYLFIIIHSSSAPLVEPHCVSVIRLFDFLSLSLAGLVSPPAHPGTMDHQDHYSTFHKTKKQKKFTKKQWQDFTKESTRQAMAEWAASPEVTNWLIENADRIQLLPSDSGSEDLVGSESDSTDENVIGSGRRFGLFNW